MRSPETNSRMRGHAGSGAHQPYPARSSFATTATRGRAAEEGVSMALGKKMRIIGAVLVSVDESGPSRSGAV